jgi:hypothetical protein
MALSAALTWQPAHAASAADLATGAVLRFGTKSAPANGSVVLNDSDSFLKSNGKCAFNLGYDMRNQGAADSGTFLNRVFMDNQVVAINTNLALTAGQSRSLITQPYLTPGTHVVKLVLDADNQVAEADESNNTLSVTVKVDSTCGASPTTPPTRPDLMSQKGVAIGGTVGGAGGTFAAWGGQIALRASDAFAQSGGKCAFNLNYDLENAGAATQQAFSNRLYNGTVLVGQQTGLMLGASEARQIMTQAYLMPGAQVLTLQIDPDHATNDSNWQNNARSVTVTVDGRCDGSSTVPTTRPAIVSTKGFTLGGTVNAVGGQFAAWGGRLLVHASDAFTVREGQCGFYYSYDLENVGTGAGTAPFGVKLQDGDRAIAGTTGLTLAAGAARIVTGYLGLTPGNHSLALVIDPNVAGKSVVSTKVDVTVDAQCRSQ